VLVFSVIQDTLLTAVLFALQNKAWHLTTVNV
jgi:hypothetical protein